MAIKFNEERYREVFQSPAGTVGRFLNRRAFQLQSAGKLIATEEKLVRTGRYRASITGRLVTEARGLVIKFGSAVGHARILEHGSPPHIIAARQKKALWWDMPNDRGWMVQPDDGRPVRQVSHPGTSPYQVLRRAVLQVFKGGTA